MEKKKRTVSSGFLPDRILGNLSLFILGVLLGSFFFFQPKVDAAVSSTMNFQARLKSSTGAIVADGTYNIEFKLYDTLAAGSSAQGVCVGGATDDCLWVETRTGANKVTVTNGYFNVYLGSVTAFGSIDWDQEIWLTMNIGGTGAASWDGEMSPRIKLTAVPYAFRAGSAYAVNSNNTSTSSTNSSAVTIGTGNATGATSNSGNISIDTGTATGTTGTISVGTANTSAITIGRTGLTTTNSGALTVAQLITGQLGLTITGGTASINASSNNATNINTGSSTGLVSIGGGSGTFVLDTTNIDISSAGAISGVTGYTQASGNFLQSGAGTFGTGTGAVSLNGDVTIDSAKYLALERGTDFSTTGSSNDVSIPGSLIRLTGASAQTITGIAGGVDGRVLTLVNAASQTATISNNSGSSSAANRIITGTGSNISLLAGASISLIYDSGASLWRVVGSAGTSSTYALASLSNLSSVAINTSLLPDTDNAYDLGSAALSWRTLYADTSVLSPSIDVASAGALSIGNTTATSVSICNSAACDTISIGTNADADTISIGDSSDTVDVAGTFTSSGASSFTASGTALSVTNNADIGGTIAIGSGAAPSSQIAAYLAHTFSSTCNVGGCQGINSGITLSGVSSGTGGYGIITGVTASSSTVTSIQGLLVSSNSVSGGAITTNYGIYVSAQNTSATGDYGIGIEAAADATLWLANSTDPTTAAGGIIFGTSQDTNLYRSAANTLRTDDSFSIGTNLTVTDSATVSGSGTALAVTNNADFGGIIAVGSTGTIVNGAGIFLSHTFTSSADCVFGCYGSYNAVSYDGVTNPTIEGAGYFKTTHVSGSASNTYGIFISNTALTAGSITSNYGLRVAAQTAGTSDYGIAVEAADTQTLWVSSEADNTTAAAGIAFGSSRDTNIYRGAANTLKTDDALDIATDSATALVVETSGGTDVLNINTSTSGITATQANTTGTFFALNASATNQTSSSALSVTQSNTTTGYTGNLVSITGTSTTGAANILNVSSANTTAGNAVNVTANSLTTGDGVDINSTGTGLTSGSLLKVTTATTGAVATNGAVSFQATGNYTSSSNIGLLSVQADSTTAGTVQNISGNALTTGVGLYVASTGTGLTSGSLLRVTSATTGAVATNGIVSLSATGNYTSSSNVGLLNLAADSTTAGTIQNISGNALTTGVGLRVASTGTGLTSGSLLVLTSATTGAVATNGIASIQATGNYTSTSNVGALSVQANSTTAGTVQNISANALTTGVGLHVASTGTGLTSGSLLYVTSATTGAVATNGIVSLNATGNYTSTSNAGLLDVKANATTTGTVVNIQGNALTTGTALNVSSTSVMTTTGNIATFTANSATTATGIVTINATGLTSGAALDINANTSANAITLNGNIQFDTDATRTITVQTQDTVATAGSNLTVSAATGNTSGIGGTLTLQGGTGGSSAAGGAVLVTGGNAGGGNTNGGNVTISGGTGSGTGVLGLVVLTTPTYDTSTVQNFTGSAAITQANIDSKSAILISANAAGYTATLSDPTTTTAGRVIYVTNSGSYDMTLAVNGGGSGNEITLKPNTTATMIWNGSDWTAAGASSSTDLQAAYDNTATSAGGAELVLNAPGGAADGLTIRNNDTTPITGGILEVQTSVGSNLFSVNNNATEYANNGGAESSTFTMWTDASSGGLETTARTTTAGTYATGQAAASIVTTGVATQGIKNTLSSTLTNSLKYQVSFAIRASSTAFTALDVMYSYDGSTTNVRHCVSGTAFYSTGTASQSGTTITGSGTTFTSAMVGKTFVFANGVSTVISGYTSATQLTAATSQTVSSQYFGIYTEGYTVNTGIWSRVTCTFTAPASGTTITASNAVLIRQTDTTTRTFYVDNLSVTASADVNHAVDGSVDDSTNFATNYTAFGASVTVTRDTSTIYDTSGSVSVATPATADRGVRNNLNIVPSVSTQYLVTFYGKIASGTFTDLRVRYTRDGGTNFVSCGDYNTQTLSTSSWTKITCLLTTDSSTATNADLVIDQPTATARTFYIDALTMTLNTNNSNNVQIGGANKGGPVTLLTLDRSSGPPIATSNDAYLGSMYYDTNTGRIQCYESDGWGACGAAPDNVVNLNPEYSGAVLNGTGVGTMTADSCGNGGGLSLNTSLCASGEARNFYKWTSPQATQQTYSIYVTYQLPATFKNFASDDTIQLTARTDSTSNAAVTYEMYKSQSGSITQCGSGETTVVTSADTWQTVGINGNESTSCSFSTSSANAFIIFKINVKANSNANAYVGTLSFTTTGN